MKASRKAAIATAGGQRAGSGTLLRASVERAENDEKGAKAAWRK